MADTNYLNYEEYNSGVESQTDIDPGIIVFVPEKQFDYSFWDSIANSGYDVFIVESENEVLQLLESRSIETLYLSTQDKKQFSVFAHRLKEKYQLKSVIFFGSIIDLVKTKSEPKTMPHIGTFGTLADLNLIDLLQIMNGNEKTCLISITSHCNQLTLYTHNGSILYALNNDIVGSQAIYDALAWKEGIWNIDPIDFFNFPEPNMNKTINSILLEGCRYMDESKQAESIQEFNPNDTMKFF